MVVFLRVLLTGLLVSFIGSLPLGTLNVAAMQISITDGVSAALQFSIGSLTAEIIYVRLSLVAMDWIRKQARLLLFFDWMTLGLLLALAISSFLCGESSGFSFRESHFEQFIAKNIVGIFDECNQSCTNSILVWMELSTTGKGIFFA